MKVLFLYKYGILGGVCTQLYHRILNLDNKKIEVHCGFMSNHGAEELLGGLCKLHFSLTPDRISEFVEEVGFDLVVVIDTEEYIQALVGLSDNVVIVTEVHTSIEKNLEYLTRLPHGFKSTFITVSQYMKREVAKRIEVEVEDITVIGNIVDNSKFNFIQVSASNQDLVPPLIWVGKIDDHKNWKMALEISDSLIKKGLNHELWIIGGHTANQTIAEEFFTMVEEKGLISYVKWYDKIEHDSMADFIRTGVERGGVGLVTSKAESFGMSILESLLVGLPVVSADTGAISEICGNREFLRLYPLEDSNVAIKHITDLIGKWIYSEDLAEKFATESLSLGATFDSGSKGTLYWQTLFDIIQGN